MGGKIVDGGVRVEIAHDRPGSKTPWNITFWAPREGHLDAKTISGGCGFYLPSTGEAGAWSSAAFCKGYGLPAKTHYETRISMWFGGEAGALLSVKIDNVIDEELKRL